MSIKIELQSPPKTSEAHIKNLDKINPMKREKIRRGLEFVDKINTQDPVINRIVVFGSAIRDDCTAESDIDLCFIGNASCENKTYRKIRGGFADAADDLCDILTYSRLNDTFKSIVDNGVEVYEY